VRAQSTIRRDTNVAQIVISGTRRLRPKGTISMPAFGLAYSETEIAAVVNYVTTRFWQRAIKNHQQRRRRIERRDCALSTHTPP
jgi:mono/diheme cytochrome c family protein